MTARCSLRRDAAGELRSGKADPALCLAARAAEQHDRSRVHLRLPEPPGPGNAPVADQGQIQLDCFGRINGAGWHWAGEADVFEAIAAVKKRFNIDDKRDHPSRILAGRRRRMAHLAALSRPLRGGGDRRGHCVPNGASGPVSRRINLRRCGSGRTSREWALNIFNLPLAGHDGENDPGQLESSLRARAQLEKEGFPSEGDPDYLHSEGAPGLWLQSKDTGHGTSPLVRQRLDAFLKEWGDKGQLRRTIFAS